MTGSKSCRSNESVPSEDHEQMLFVQWFRRTYQDVRIFAIPNGGYRSKVTAARLKVTGVVPGVPDLFVPELKLWIEMKRQKGGRLTESQKDWINYLEKSGYSVMVCYGFDDAKRSVIEWFNKLRGSEK